MKEEVPSWHAAWLHQTNRQMVQAVQVKPPEACNEYKGKGPQKG